MVCALVSYGTLRFISLFTSICLMSCLQLHGSIHNLTTCKFNTFVCFVHLSGLFLPFRYLD
jgi:hypothetical protein